MDKINFTGLEKISNYVFDVSQYLAQRGKPLSFQAAGEERHPEAMNREKTGSRPWLGTVPDFSYQGNDGLKLTGVSAGSPCEKAGLQAGDLITQIDDVEIKSIYELNHVLVSHKPGDEITVTFVRNGTPKTVQIVLAQR